MIIMAASSVSLSQPPSVTQSFFCEELLLNQTREGIANRAKQLALFGTPKLIKQA
jgi:hypothetical protein